MPQDIRVSACIEAAQPFAQPILNQLRASVHAAAQAAAGRRLNWRYQKC